MITYNNVLIYDIDIDVHHNVITCTITISGKEWSERYDTEVCRTSNRDVASNKALISDGSSENFSFDQYYKPIVLYIFSTLSPSYRLETKNVGDKLKLFKLITRSSLYVFLWTNNDKNIQIGISIRYDNNNKRISRNINTRR